ncbi:hypothetical protein [Pyxidicoccus xibeiensis]|nr:hypothetical protein [Pyxidicoccus xibeiensis]
MSATAPTMPGSTLTWDPAHKLASSRTAMTSCLASLWQHLSHLAP